MATKHSAEFEGFRFTRTSKGRVYSHAVLVRCSLSANRAAAEESARRSWATNLSYHQAMAEKRNPLASKYPESYTVARVEADAVEAQAYLAAGVEGYVARTLARFDELNAGRQLAADGDTFYACSGWASRLDLAMKAAGSAHGFVVAAVTA